MPSIKHQLHAFFRFCPHCGRRFSSRRVHGAAERYCAYCDFTFWQSSKPTASVLLVRGGKVLLTKRAIHPKKGAWDFPGGFLDVHEHPLAGLQREMQEELGVRIIQPKLLGVYIDTYPGTPPQSTFNLTFVATKWRGTPKAADDVASIHWVPLRAIPKRVAFPMMRDALRDLRRLLRA